MAITEFKDYDQFLEGLEAVGDKTLLLRITSSSLDDYYEPDIKVNFEYLSNKYNDVVFCMVNEDVFRQTASDIGDIEFPCYQFYKNKKVLAPPKSYNPEELVEKLNELGSAKTDDVGEDDVNKIIDTNDVVDNLVPIENNNIDTNADEDPVSEYDDVINVEDDTELNPEKMNEVKDEIPEVIEKKPIDMDDKETNMLGLQQRNGNLNPRRSSNNGDDYEMQTINDVEDNTYRQSPRDDYNKMQMRPMNNPHSISWRWAIIILAAGCLLFYLVHLNDHALPTVVGRYEAEQDTSLFSGERSKASLIRLTNLGPRVVGHEANEIETPKLIHEEVKEAIYTAHPSQSIQIETQKGSGAYQLGFVPSFTNIYENVQNVLVKVSGSDGSHGILVNCHYDTVPEVDGASDDGISCAVMLELIRVLAKAPKRLEHNVIFLFNGAEEVPLQGSHLFLSHKWANNTRIVLNLEAAGAGGRSILFQSGPKNAWIFKYYSKYAPHPHGQVMAEEMFQGGMIPSDTDFRIFRDFGNMPGLDFAFSRSGHVYHTKYDSEQYISAGSHQHMGDNTLALLNSLGNAPELYDMNANSEGTMVYYDYLGWFMISYSYGGSIAINLFTIGIAIFSIIVFIGRLLRWSWLPESTPIAGKKFEKVTMSSVFSKFRPESRSRPTPDPSSPNQDYVHVDRQLEDDVRRKGAGLPSKFVDVSNVENDLNNSTRPMKPLKPSEPQHNLTSYFAVLIEIGLATAARVVGMGAAIGVTAIVALIVNSAATLGMPWYSNVWLLFPLYWCPCLIVSAIIPHFVDVWRSKKHNLSLSFTAQLNIIAAQIPWIFIYFIMMCTGSRSAALFFLPTLCAGIANLVILLTPLYLTAQKWVWVYLAIHIPAILMNMYVVLLGYVTFLPVMARSGVINGDLNIAIVTCILCLFLTSFVLPLMTLVRRPGVVFGLLSLFSILMIIISLSSSIGHPYQSGPSDPKPQRYWIMHTLREYRNETGHIRLQESGYFVLNLDGNSPKTMPIRGRSNLRSLRDDCEHEQYCGLPLYMTRMVPLSAASSWIPAGVPVQPVFTELSMDSKNCDNTTLLCTLEFSLKGPDRMTLTFAPFEDASLVQWSIPSGIEPSGVWKGRPSYYLHIVRGELKPIYKIALQFKVTLEMANKVKPILDIGLAGNHVHHENKRTKEFQNLLDSLPEWTHRTGWISAYKSYVF